jgi:hypothetical protein
VLLEEEEVAERSFEDWSMAFRDLDSVDATTTPGYSPFLNSPLNGPELTSDPTAARRLLASFKQSM